MPTATLVALRADRAAVLTRAGFDPEPNQAAFLRSAAPRELLLTTRQFGKSTTAAGLAVSEAVLTPGALVLLLSPTLRQSAEVYLKAVGVFDGLGRPVPEVRRTATTLELANGSRVVSLPGTPENVRGFSRPRLVVIDEAAFVRDELYAAVTPMLARSVRGRLVAVTTPYGQRGYFFEQWSKGGDGWRRTTVTADQVASIPAAFLESERSILGPRWFEQEYFCRFVATLDAAFDPAAVEQALESGVRPLFMGEAA
jgi:hypothetical protein